MKILIHIGYGKTATTWMQDRFFSSIKEINYLGKTTENYPDWLIEWSYLDDFEFKKKKYLLKDIILSKCRPDKLNVISSEAFLRPGGVYINQARRIKAIFPEAQILVVVRDPINAIVSFYKNHVQEQGFYLPLEDCIDLHRTPMVFYKRKPIFLADYYYNEMLEAYHSFFHKSQILLLQYEEFCNDTKEFFHNLFNFMSISAKISKKLLSIKDNRSVKCTNELNSLREINLKKHIRKYLTNDNAIKIDDESIKNETIAKLKKHLSGKCLNYYL